MSDFVFLYRGSQPPASQEERQKVMQKWMAWFQEIGAKGHVKDPGQPLERAGKVINSDKTVTDGPFAETKDLVGGFSLINADDLSAAAEIAKGCPIYDRGGIVEIRPVMKMDM